MEVEVEAQGKFDRCQWHLEEEGRTLAASVAALVEELGVEEEQVTGWEERMRWVFYIRWHLWVNRKKNEGHFLLLECWAGQAGPKSLIFVCASSF
jgi:hypothetical protein